jgi:parallel beta-helix repeat protein
MNLPGTFSNLLRLAAMLFGCLGAVAACGAGAAVSAEPDSDYAAAYVLYVAPNGWDSNPGTRGAPFKSIARAARSALPGTTIMVAPGTYAGGFKTTASGTAAARIRFVSTTRWGARLVPPANSANKVAWDNRGNHVDIVGFEVDGGAYQGGAEWTIGIYNGGSNDTIRDNHVHHIGNIVRCTSAGGAGITVDSYYHGGSSDVIGNSVHDIGRPGCRYIQGIYFSTNGKVSNNIVYRIGEAGIHLWHDANNVVVSNNTVAGSNTGILVGGGDFYFTTGPNDHTHVYNNIVYDNERGISEQGLTGKNNTYRNNLVFQNTIANWRLRNGLVHSGTVEAEPEFIRYARTGTPDFRLSSTSPAIGKGTPPYVPSEAPGSLRRTANVRYDIGAEQH